MNSEHRCSGRLALALIAAGLAAAAWVAEPLAQAAFGATTLAQVQPTPSTKPVASPTPTRTPEQQFQDQQLRKLQNEVRMLDAQHDRLRQEEAVDKQAWRAPAAAVAAFGPTLVGLWLLYLLARALSHWLPPAPEKPSPPPEEEEEEDL